MKVSNIQVSYTPMEPPNPPMVDVTFDVVDDEFGVVKTVTLTGVNLVVGTPASEQIKRLIWSRAQAEYEAWRAERERWAAAEAAAKEIVETLENITELTEEDVPQSSPSTEPESTITEGEISTEEET